MALRKILIVDDEADFVAVMRMRLEACGYEIFSADNGAEGLEVARRSLPDCILLDIGMPGVDGFTFVTSMKQIPQLKNVPIIIVSGRGDEMKGIFSQEGVCDYLVKPFQTQDLLDIIQKRIA